jgi:hypothetical protein
MCIENIVFNKYNTKLFFIERDDIMEKCANCGSPVANGNRICVNCLEKSIRENARDLYSSNKETVDKTQMEIQKQYVEEKNGMSSVLKIIGWITIILGFIVGGYVAYNSDEDMWFFIIAALSLIQGILFIAFGEVIRLLQGIKDKLK